MDLVVKPVETEATERSDGLVPRGGNGDSVGSDDSVGRDNGAEGADETGWGEDAGREEGMGMGDNVGKGNSVSMLDEELSADAGDVAATSSRWRLRLMCFSVL